jgi:hypothetical protein
MSLLLDSFFFFPRIFFEELQSTNSQFWTPKADIKTTEKELIISLELPGVKKDHLNVEVSVYNRICFFVDDVIIKTHCFKKNGIYNENIKKLIEFF